LGTADLVVLLGTPTPASSRLYALTVTEGDPTWAGPLAGEALGLPVFHVIEPEVKAQVDEQVYQAEVGMTELALEDPDEIVAAVRGVRSAQAGSAGAA
jgi:glycine/sarcosine/betaine reductase complex component A